MEILIKLLRLPVRLPYDNAKSLALSNISKTLLENRNIDRAIEVAHTIPNDYSKNFALKDICKHVQRLQFKSNQQIHN